MVTHNLLKLSSSFADILDKQKRGINNANISNLWVGKKMKDDNFLKANNAKHLWHPMGHPKESLEKPPKIIRKAEKGPEKSNEKSSAERFLYNIVSSVFARLTKSRPLQNPLTSSIQ